MAFWNSKIAPDDLRRVSILEEKVESVQRRLEGLLLDLEDFYAKVNKARQRVVKSDRDAAAAGLQEAPLDRAALKAQMRLQSRRG